MVICLQMRKKITAKSPLGDFHVTTSEKNNMVIFTSPLSKLHYYHNKQLQVKESQVGVCMGQVRSGWEDFLTQPTMVGQKKNSTQPNPSHKSNPTHIGQVGSSWTHGFDKFSLLLLLYWVEKNININILKKTED